MPQLRLPHSPDEYLDYTLILPKGRSTTDTLVIYVHGFASHQKGEKVLYFRDRFTDVGAAFLAFDHRGHGDSSGTMKDLTITRNLEDLEAVFSSQALNYKKRILIGSSMGGQTAAWYAAHHPGRVTANLLIAPGFRFLENCIRDLGPEGLKKLKTEGQVTIKSQWGELTIGKALFEDGKQYPIEKLLSAYSTPTLIIHGTDDDTVPFEDSVVFIRRSKARPLELLLIAGGDHRLTDYKETLFSAMESFCKRINLL